MKIVLLLGMTLSLYAPIELTRFVLAYERYYGYSPVRTIELVIMFAGGLMMLVAGFHALFSKWVKP